MDMFLGKVTQQAMNYAIRSGITLTATYAIRQSGKLLQNAPQSLARDELYDLHQRLQHKVRIVSPAIDLIELIAARGNTALESAVSLAKELRLEIQDLTQRVTQAAAASEQYTQGSSRTKANLKAQNEQELKEIVKDVKNLIARIEDAVPLINLALTTSGAKLSTQLPSTVSPSRLLQASTFLTSGDTQYAMSPDKVAQIGPTFTLSVYMLFAGHNRPQNEEEIRDTTWKEVIHKARVKLRRVPLDIVVSTGSGSDAIPSREITDQLDIATEQSQQQQMRAGKKTDEYAYQIMIIEDMDDDRIHDFEGEEFKPGPFDDVARAGIREMLPVHEISKIFYADTSKVLNIGMDAEANHPVLLLRRDVNAVPPRRMLERDAIDTAGSENKSQSVQEEADKQYREEDHADRRRDPWRLPPSLDPEWIAFEVYTESNTSDYDSAEENSEDDLDTKQSRMSRNLTPQIEASMANLNITSPSPTPSSTQLPQSQSQMSFSNHSQSNRQQPWAPAIKTSLSLLELLLRLTSLQQFQQQSHLSITDELLNFFLEESASTGAGGDEGHRQALRADARRRVGWDPYNESPVRRHGEEYQYQYQYQSPGQFSSPQQFQNQDMYYNEMSSNSPIARSKVYYDPTTVMSPSGPVGNNGLPRASPHPSLGSERAQAKSLTGTPVSMSASPSGVGRPEWLRRQEYDKQKQGGRVVNAAKPNTARIHSDEGIGTSPASSGLSDGRDLKQR